MTDPKRMDNPNQQAVRPDGSGPSDEGSGGGKPSPPEPEPKKKRTTKDDQPADTGDDGSS